MSGRVEILIRDRLADTPATAAVFGTTPLRCYPLRLPERTTLPAIVYQRISGPATHTHSGPLTLRTQRYQLSVWDTDYDRGRDAAIELQRALVGVGEWGGYHVFATLLDDAEDSDPDVRGMFRQRIDLGIQSSVDADGYASEDPS